MDVFSAAPHHDVLVLLIQIAVLLATARLLGELAQRVGQPSVVGEILAGIVLGPSLLSGIFPDVGDWLVPHNETQGYLLEMVGLIGVMLLLLITGLETDIALIRSQAKSAIGVALGGLVVPLLMGFALGQIIPGHLLTDSDDRFVFSLYLAIALAISAIPVIAKVLMDLKLTRRDVGQTIIAAAMIDDTTGWILLSIVIGLAGGAAVTAGTVVESAGSVLGFMVVSFTVGYWLVKRLLRFVQNHIQSQEKMLSLVMMLAFLWGAISQGLNLEAMLGAFVMGILLSQMPSLDSEVVHKIESFTLGIFAPIFFAIAGLKVNVRSLLEPDLIFIALGVILAAALCKIAGVYLGARLIGRSDHWTALFYGAGLNARGSMGIIIANIGLTLGLLTQDMFSIIVVMAVVTSLMAPTGLRWALRNIQMDERELERLRREELNKTNVIANVHRVLLPVRLREHSTPTQTIEARILDNLSANPLALTLMTVTADESHGQTFLDELSRLFPRQEVSRRVALSDNPTDSILNEVKKGYDLMVLGATERQTESGSLFTPMIDTLVRLSPAPSLIVHAPHAVENWQPRRILAATAGAVAGRRAVQLAFALAAQTGGEVIILKVVQKNVHLYTPSEFEERQLNIAHEIVSDLEDMGQLFGVTAIGEVEIGTEAEATILETAHKRQVDLIVLGTSVRPGSESLYLGPKVEHILRHAECPVMVFNSA